jgi:hypothetical protein
MSERIDEIAVEKAESVVKELCSLLTAKLAATGLQGHNNFPDILMGLLGSFIFNNICALHEATEVPLMVIYKAFSEQLSTVITEKARSQLPPHLAELAQKVEEAFRRAIETAQGENNDSQTVH